MPGIADFLRNPWSSPYDDSADPRQRQQQSGLAWLAAAQAMRDSPGLISGISRGMLGGNQIYGQGISGIAAAQAEEERRRLDEEYRRSLMANSAQDNRRLQEQFEFTKGQAEAATTEQREQKRINQEAIDSVLGGVLSQVEPGSMEASEARALAATGNLNELRKLSDEIEARKRLEAAGVDPNDPLALQMMEERRLKREGLGRYYEPPGGGSGGGVQKSPWEIRSENGRTAYIPTGGPDSGLEPRFAFEGTDPIREEAIAMVKEERKMAMDAAIQSDEALDFDFERRVKETDAMLRRAYGIPEPGAGPNPPRISLNQVIQEAMEIEKANGKNVTAVDVARTRRKVEELRAQGVPDEEIAKRIMDAVKK